MRYSDSPYLFISRYSEQLSPARPNRVVKTAAEYAGLQETAIKHTDGYTGNDRHQDVERRRITSYMLRHSFAVHSVRDGREDLVELLGHSSIRTTEKYLRFKNETKRNAMLSHASE